ncbi:MAG: penicillin acylase family protein [Bacteroidetes bacterium]|nr:penicillin acylase family protein [Bacteroidota bacterium]
MTGKAGRLLRSASGLTVLFILLKLPVSGGFVVGDLLDPVNGLYRTALRADRFDFEELSIPALSDAVQVVRDSRGVPHIFAENDRDALIAFGYVVAQDRLFQMDFIPRSASGRLSEVLGSGALSTDRFFRRIGFPWAAKKNIEWLKSTGSIQMDLIDWYQTGANAYISSLRPEDDPFEFRVSGYRPSLLEPVDAILVLQYMTYDLTYRGDDAHYSALMEGLDEEEYNRLFPQFSRYFVPIIPPEEEHWTSTANDDSGLRSQRVVERLSFGFIPEPETFAEGYRTGKGSNNWAVGATRSTTGYPILAGDMHLSLSLPAIWYEAHLVTPTMNVYGVTIPGTPVIVEGITPTTAWVYTNTGSDQIDYYALRLGDDRKSYFIDDRLEAMDVLIDTIRIAGMDDVIDTLYYSRFGPVLFDGDNATAIRWVAHDTTRTLESIWKMGHASNYDEFENALRYWDSPMQNILFAGRSGTIAIRSTGYMPVRGGESGAGVLDGSRSANEWTARVPFEELPHSILPERGYLTSTNQQPAAEGYPYYLGHDWRDAYRSIRIDELLSGKSRHSVADLKSYQADVHAVQADLFVPVLQGIDELSERAGRVRRVLISWDRETRVDQKEPILFHEFLSTLKRFVWDETIFTEHVIPADSRTLTLILDKPESRWFDRVSTPETETAEDILRMTLEHVAEKYGDELERGGDSLRWGEHHQLVIRHLTRSTALRALWRGPYPFQGYRQTLSPGDNMMTTSSASWRVVVDFSTNPPTAFGVYPGGQSGNPFSRRYDDQVTTYLNFDYNALQFPAVPEEVETGVFGHHLTLIPDKG